MFSHIIPNMASHNPLSTVIQSACSPPAQLSVWRVLGSVPSFVLVSTLPSKLSTQVPAPRCSQHDHILFLVTIYQCEEAKLSFPVLSVPDLHSPSSALLSSPSFFS